MQRPPCAPIHSLHRPTATNRESLSLFRRETMPVLKCVALGSPRRKRSQGCGRRPVRRCGWPHRLTCASEAAIQVVVGKPYERAWSRGAIVGLVHDDVSVHRLLAAVSLAHVGARVSGNRTGSLLSLTACRFRLTHSSRASRSWLRIVRRSSRERVQLMTARRTANALELSRRYA
jgi:hypothetical protein